MRRCRMLVVVFLMLSPVMSAWSNAGEERSNRANGCTQSPDRSRLPTDGWPDGTVCQVIDDGDPFGTGRSRMARPPLFRIALGNKTPPRLIRRVN